MGSELTKESCSIDFTILPKKTTDNVYETSSLMQPNTDKLHSSNADLGFATDGRNNVANGDLIPFVLRLINNRNNRRRQFYNENTLICDLNAYLVLGHMWINLMLFYITWLKQKKK